MKRRTARRAASVQFLSVCLSSCAGMSGDAESAQYASSCAGCQIVVERIATLGAMEDPGSPVFNSTVAIDSRGRFYVGPTSNPGEVFVYDEAGEFLQTIGARGGGPGEFSEIHHVSVGQRDELNVFGVARRTVFSSSYQVLYTHPLPRAFVYSVLFPDSALVLVQAHEPSPERMGKMVHLVDRQGTVLESFGSSPGEYRRDAIPDIRALSPAARGGFWLAQPNRYQVERWDFTGELLQTIQREVPWFEPWDTQSPRPFTVERPLPVLSSVREDGEGRLWLAFRVAREDWAPLSGADRAGSVPLSSLPDPAEYIEARVEVLDGVTGGLVVQERISGRPISFIGHDLAYRYRRSVDGVDYIEIVRLRLEQPERGER